jgi:tetratricopeptide (TPR) repeat protein
MSDRKHPALRLDAACDRFESAWRGGQRPRIEEALGEVTDSERTELLRELLPLELELRRSAGETPTPDEYRTRFLTEPELIADAFAEANAAGAGSTGTPHRFQILRPHARGGLGEVFVAFDTELHREVALKEIQRARADDPETRTRFVLEAEITGNLEHPGIVPVYALGSHGDGRPYYAMRFVEGDSMMTAIAQFHAADVRGRDPGERTLALRDLLHRFIDVCKAIAYAHSRAVLHRDLKPQNVMLGKYGETLVVDWGLAKAAGPAFGRETKLVERPYYPRSSGDSTPTVVGAALGTKAFMSPEQAAGAIERIGPWSDIYSLGATLACLLTGESPRASTPPRRIKREVPIALDAVCRKAMAPRPEDRYASARALAEDVEHWLADEPVTAWREPWARRARRWARRHDSAVAATATAMLVSLVLSGTGLFIYQQQVQQQTLVARSALARAEQARDDARSAWSERLDVSAWLRAGDLAAAATAHDNRWLSAGLRAQLRRHASSVATEMGQARGDATLLERLAEVRARSRSLAGYDGPAEYQRAFDMHGLRAETSHPSAAAEPPYGRPGSVAVRLAAYLDDWALLSQLRRRSADLPHRLTTWANAFDPDSRRVRLRRALCLTDEAVRRQALLRMAEEPGAADGSAFAVTLLSTALRLAGRPDATVRILETARFRHPEDPWIHQELGLALLRVRPSRREDALRAFAVEAALRPESASDLARTLRDMGRTTEAVVALEAAVRRRRDSTDLVLLGTMNAALGRTAEAGTLYRQAAETSRRTLSRAPQDQDANNNLAAALALLGDIRGAIAAFRSALRADPGSAMVHANLSLALRAAGDLREAVAEARAAINLDPDLATARNTLGVCLCELNDLPGAAAAFRRAIEAGPEDPQAYTNLGTVLKLQGDRAGGIHALRQAIAIQPDLPAAHFNLGNALRESGDLPGAVRAFREAVRLQPDLLQAHANLGHVLGVMGDFAGAADSLHHAREIAPRGTPAWEQLDALLRQAERGNIRAFVPAPAELPVDVFAP